MGFFTDIFGAAANGAIHTAADRLSGSTGLRRVEELCAKLGWGIDERVEDKGVVLHFRDPSAPGGIRQVLIVTDTDGELAVLSCHSAARLRASTAPPADRLPPARAEQEGVLPLLAGGRERRRHRQLLRVVQRPAEGDAAARLQGDLRGHGKRTQRVRLEVAPGRPALRRQPLGTRSIAVIDMGDPKTWPLADVLPLARPVAGELWPELGVMIAQRPLTVFLANAFEPGLHRRLAECGRVVYRSGEELRADGWVID